MDATLTSYWHAAQAARAWQRGGIIDGDSVSQLIHIATHAALPGLRAAARRTVSEMNCGHMIAAGERRGMVG